MLIVIVFFRLINHNNRINTSTCIHRIFLATFAIVTNTNAIRAQVKDKESEYPNDVVVFITVVLM